MKLWRNAIEHFLSFWVLIQVSNEKNSYVQSICLKRGMKLRLNLWVKNGNKMCWLWPPKHVRDDGMCKNKRFLHILWVEISETSRMDVEFGWKLSFKILAKNFEFFQKKWLIEIYSSLEKYNSLKKSHSSKLSMPKKLNFCWKRGFSLLFCLRCVQENFKHSSRVF